jgi:hypothetical protein
MTEQQNNTIESLQLNNNPPTFFNHPQTQS